jgi:hypothetical protein
MNTSEWFHLVGLISALLLGLGFIFGLISVGLSWKLNREQNAEIANTRKETEEAKAEAARANESAAQLIERAQNLEQENIELRTDLENATAEARNKQIELTLEQQKTAAAQKEAAQALMSAQFNLQQIRSLHMPRRLIAGQNREKFLRVLKGKPVASVDILWFADSFILEPKRFAEDIAEALTEAGWLVDKIHGGSLVADSDPLNVKVLSGLKIKVRSLSNIPSSADALFGAFLSSGLVAEFMEDEKLEDGPIRIIVFMIPPNGGRVLRFQQD